MFNSLLDKVRQAHQSVILICVAVFVFSASGAIKPKVDYHRATTEALAIEKMQKDCENLSRSAAKEFQANFEDQLRVLRIVASGTYNPIRLTGEGGNPEMLASAYARQGICSADISIFTLQEILYKIFSPISAESQLLATLAGLAEQPVELSSSISEFIPKYGAALLFEKNDLGLTFVSINGARLIGPADSPEYFQQSIFLSYSHSEDPLKRRPFTSSFSELVEWRPLTTRKMRSMHAAWSPIRILPGLTQVAQAHGNIPLADIRSLIESKEPDVSRKEEATLFGFALPLNLLQFGAPISIMLMTWYMYSLLVRLRAIIPESRPEERRAVWIGVFPEQGPIIATFLSIVIIPVLAIAFLHWSISEKWDRWWDASLLFSFPFSVWGVMLKHELDWIIAAIPSLAAVLAVSIAAYRKTSEVRRRLR
jgi:hypothetical protein